MGPRSKGITSSSLQSLDSRTADSKSPGNNSAPQSPREEAVYSSQEYPIKFILDESGGKYLIAWEGPFEPTWEPKSCANYAAVQAWELEKQKRSISSKQYQEQRPKRSCQAYCKPLALLSSASPVTPSQQSIESQQLSNPYSCINSLSQRTSLSGSIFCPGTSSQRSQISSSGCASGSSYIPSAENQTLYNSTTPRSSHQYSQDYSIPDSTADTWVLESTASSYTLRERALKFANPSYRQYPHLGGEEHLELSIYPSQASFASNTSKSAHPTPLKNQQSQGKPRSWSFTHEVPETPPSRLFFEERLENRSSDQVSEQNLGINSPTGHRSNIQSASEFQTPFPKSTAGTGFCESIPKSEYQSAEGWRSYLKPTVSRSFIEESPPAIASPSLNKSGHLTRKRRALQRTASELLPKSCSIDYPPCFNRSFVTMNSSASNNHPPQISAIVEEAEHHTRETSVSERMKQLWDTDRVLRKPLNSLTQSTTPSSAEDINASAPPNASNIVSPLNAQLEKGTTSIIEGGKHSPTPVPFVAPQALHYNVEQITPALATVEPSIQAEATEFDVSSTQEQEPDALDQEVNALDLSEMEFAIPLSMDCRVKDEYDNTLASENKYVEKFLEVSPQSSEMVLSEGDAQALFVKMTTMVEKLDNITTHPDINIGSQAAGDSPDTAKEALWAEYSSSKFQYLGYFIDASKGLELHIIIMVKPGRTVDVVKRYLMGKQFIQHSPPEGGDGDSPAVFSKEKISFEVRSTADEREIPPSKPPALIIALDSSFDANFEPVKKLRIRSDFSVLIPVVRLIIANTVEHVKICLPMCTELTSLRLLVQHTLACNDAAGELQDDALGVQENAEETLLYIMENPATRTWKLPLMEALEIEGQQDEGLISELDPTSSTNASRQKRWLEGEMGDSTNPSKRQRITPTHDITHISDSLKDQTQTQNVVNTLATQSHWTSPATTVDIENLRHILTSTKAKVKELEASIGSLQYRYEAKHNLLHQTRHELDVERESAKKSQTRLERQKEEISRLKDRNAGLVAELEAARNTIKSGGGLEADLEKSREDVRRLEKTIASLERTVQQERSQTEYTRQQYQTASTSAAQSAMEARRLDERVQDLEKKANGEAVRLKELKMKKDGEMQLARIKELEALLATREALLTRKEEEIREMKKNRPSTRATSMQPRSPKYGASRPSSPGPNNIGSAVRGSALKFRAEI
ncbi:hypothetical protein MauCBS54593_006788 [Microsporum audouinii]